MTRYVMTLCLLLAMGVLHRVILGYQAEAAETSAPPALLNLPSQILNFHQSRPDAPVDANTRKLLETNTILMRDYASTSGAPVQLAIVYAETTRRSLHFPEVCLTGQGWEVNGKDSIPVGVLFLAKKLTLQKANEREAVIYWFKTGRHLTGNYLLNSYHWAREKLLLHNPSTMLVRLSTPIGKQGEEPAFQLLNDFACGLTPILLETIP